MTVLTPVWSCFTKTKKVGHDIVTDVVTHYPLLGRGCCGSISISALSGTLDYTCLRCSRLVDRAISCAALTVASCGMSSEA